jgi:hypothetical protein
MGEKQSKAWMTDGRIRILNDDIFAYWYWGWRERRNDLLAIGNCEMMDTSYLSIQIDQCQTLARREKSGCQPFPAQNIMSAAEPFLASATNGSRWQW